MSTTRRQLRTTFEEIEAHIVKARGCMKEFEENDEDEAYELLYFYWIGYHDAMCKLLAEEEKLRDE
jgi:hypothetical protein